MGSTPAPPSHGPHPRDHPHVCGEHDAQGLSEYARRGSSPRMGGTGRSWNTTKCPRDHPRVCGEHTAHPIEVSVAEGIIPTYAGSTVGLSNGDERVGDHPRVCGEHVLPYRPTDNSWGSSPRMRGAHGAGHVVRDVRGIIPAYAGSTHRRWPAKCWHWDHPRVCGEHFVPNLFRPFV